jgi:hypothetical protein
MATINEQLIKAYQGMTAEQQAKIYSAWNSQVKSIIDAYKSTQNNTAQPQPVAKPTTQQMVQTAEQVKAKLDQAVASGATSQANATKAYNTWLSQYNTAQPQAETQPATPPATATQTPPAKYDWLQWDVELKDIEGSTTGIQLYKWFADYQDESQRRLQEIASNVKNFYTTNPEVFSNYDTFKNFFSYNDRVDNQKQVLDSFRQVKIKWDWLATKWINDLLWLYINWWLSSSDLDWMKSQNPSKYNELMWLINKKTELAKYDEALNETKSENPFQSIINNYTANMLSMAGSSSNMFAEYKAAMNSTEMKDMRNWLAELEWEMRQLDEQMNNIRRNVEERYEWTWATRPKINAIIQDELWKLQEARSALWIEYQTLASKYNNQMSTIKDWFEMQIKEQEYNNSQRNQQMQEMWFMMNLMNFETNAQRDEREWNNFIRQQEYQNWDIFSNDPKVRNKAIEKAVDTVLQEFSGIPMIRSREQMVEDITVLVNGGMSLWEAITENIRKPIMEKPEYKKIMSDKFGVKYDQNVVNIGWKDYIQTTDANGEISFKPFVDQWLSEKINDYTYNKIDLWDGRVIGIGQTVNFNGTDYKITQLWGSMTGWVDLYSSNRVIWAFEWWTVVGQWVDKSSGNRFIEILWDNGYVYRYNHLKEAGDWYQTYAIWTKVAQWQQIWIMWNTGKVRSASGWDWTHLDLAVYSGDRATNKNVSPLDIVEQTRILFWAWGQPVATDISWTLTERANILRSTMSKQARDSFDEALKNAWWDATLTENIIKDMEIDKYYDRIKDPLKNYQKAEEPLKEINNAFSRIDAVWQAYKADPKSVTSKNALDQVLVIWLNKILDPWSVVRESEFARAPEWMSFFNKWEWKIAKIQEWWVWLTDSERNEIINAVTLMKKWQQQAINTYKNDLLLAWKTLNVPESFIYGMIWGESKFSTDNMQPQIDPNQYFWNLINTSTSSSSNQNNLISFILWY